MTRSKWAFLGTVGMGLAVCVLALQPGLGARQAAVAIDDDDIGGVVTGPNGPEAGVWVIAETMDLPTRFNRSVVTDDEGRYVVPDLPEATYDVWVRGYGLVDSPKQQASPGTRVDHTAVVAPDAQAAAQYYPSGYWYALLEVPGPEEFPGTGQDGNGISPSVPNQAAWLRGLKSGGVHRLSRAREQGHARDSARARRVRFAGGGLGPPHPVRAGRGQHERGPRPDGPPPRARDVRRLDRPHHGRRGAARGAAAAPGGGTGTWSSPSGTGPTPPPTSTTRHLPTSATPP